MKYEGNLTITRINAHQYKDLTEVTGNLSINSKSRLEALKSVGGNLDICSGSRLEANNLESVGDNLSIYSGARLEALKSVGGYLSINSKSRLEALKSVGGYLYICSEARLEALKSVGGNLYICSGSRLEANNLESVGDNLSINSKSRLEALKSVGGYLSIRSKAIKDFPNNVRIKCLRNICGNIGRMKFENIDGVACAVLSSKSKDGLIIKRCRRSVFKDGGLIGDQFYVASNDKNNAHGKTIKEAIEELHFKEMGRDIEQYRNMPLNTRKTPKQWALIYRAITGACKLGTKMFMEEKRLKKTYSLKQILEETKNSYGSERFREVVSE